MGAFDHKGQLVYVNSPLASLLGYKLNLMKNKDIMQLMPQPYGVLHLSYLKVRMMVVQQTHQRCGTARQHRPQPQRLAQAHLSWCSTLTHRFPLQNPPTVISLMCLKQQYRFFAVHCGMQDADRLCGKGSAGSCRSNMTSIMLSSNNTPVYVIPTILPHTQAATVGGLALLSDGGSSGNTYAFKVQRSSKMQYMNERRLMLGVTADGRVVWTSGTPDSLFGLQTQGLIGQDIDSMVDVFADYSHGEDQVNCSLVIFAVELHTHCCAQPPHANACLVCKEFCCASVRTKLQASVAH